MIYFFIAFCSIFYGYAFDNEGAIEFGIMAVLTLVSAYVIFFFYLYLVLPAKRKASETTSSKESLIYKGYWFHNLKDAVEAAELYNSQFWLSARQLHTEFFRDPRTERFYLWIEIKKEDEEYFNEFLTSLLNYSQSEEFPEYGRTSLLFNRAKLLIKENVFEKLAYYNAMYFFYIYVLRRSKHKRYSI